MVKDFIHSGHCIKVTHGKGNGKPHGAHCSTCLTNSTWRESVGAPDICPHGITLDKIPKQPTFIRIAGVKMTKIVDGKPCKNCQPIIIKSKIIVS